MMNFQPTLWDQVDEKWLPFREARQYAREFNFEYREEWEEYIGENSLHEGVPEDPHIVYRHTGWKNWADWLVEPSKRRNYSRFADAREYARCLRITSREEWLEFLSENGSLAGQYGLTLPRHPQYQYKKSGWISWDDWLGLSIDYKDFEATRKFVRTLKLKSKDDWFHYCRNKRTYIIYWYPEISYRNGEWKGWDDWLGIKGATKGNSQESGLPEGAILCRCQGRLANCLDCDGKGYY
jgi:hypothetical protein